MKNNNEKRFYVYECFNKDTGEVFYVGKGTGSRYRTIKGRNQYFINYHNKYDCSVRKIYKDLTEKEAFDLEIKTIEKYRKIGQCQCNMSEGGEGCTYKDGSRNKLIQQLTAVYNDGRYINLMNNEKEYQPKNLKTKTKEELENLWEEYENFRDGIRTERYLDLEEDINMFEAKIRSEEIKFLIEMNLNNICKTNKKYKDIHKELRNKDEFYIKALSINFDELLNKITFENVDFYRELISCVVYSLKALRKFSYVDKVLKVLSFDINDYKYVDIKFRDIMNDNKIKRVRINISDIVGDLMIFFTELDLYMILRKEIIESEFID